MADEPTRVALEVLAAQLHRAGDARIYDMFASDYWLRQHLDSAKLDWSGYAADLALAFDSLHEEIAAGTAPARLIMRRLVQLCVVRSTMASSENLPDSVVSRAVRTGAWPVDRATATIRRYRDRGRQASAYIAMLRGEFKDAERGAVQASLTALAFVAPGKMPAAELLQAISLLEASEQRAVADRLALCPMAPNDPQAIWQRRASGNTVLSAPDAVAMMLANPEARRPALVKATIDNVLREAARISEMAATPYRRPAEAPRSLDDLLMADGMEITYGDYVGRPQILTALRDAVPLVAAYPKPGEMPTALVGCMGCAASEEEWESLATAYTISLQDVGVSWQPPVYTPAERYKSPQWAKDQERLWWLRQILIRTGRAADAHLGRGEEPFTAFAVEALESAWVDRALALMNQPEGAARRQDTPIRPVFEQGELLNGDMLSAQSEARQPVEPESGEADEDAHQLVRETVTRGIAPTIAAMAVAAGGGPPDAVDDFASETFDREFLTLQLHNLDRVASEARVEPAIARRMMGGLLRRAMEENYRTRGSFFDAWPDVDAELVEAADLTPIVDFILKLPAEPERGYAADLFKTHDVDPHDVPLLMALELVGPHLDETNAVRLVATLLGVTRTEVRNRGLGLLAPRLSLDALERILRLNWRPADSRELAWVLREIADGSSAEATAARRAIEDMALEAATGIEDGWAYVDAVLHTRSGERFSAAEAVADPKVLTTVRRMSINDRTDALRGLSHHANRDERVSQVVFEEILALPSVNSLGTYSWRAVALLSCSSLLNAPMASRALDAAMEIPERLGEGDGQSWGRDWTNDFVRAAVVNALAPALASQDAQRAFEYAKNLPYVAREPVFRSLAPIADRALAGRLFDHAVERYRDYLRMDLPSAPRVIEQVVSLDSPDEFLLQRQVQTAELIAEMLDRLDGDRRRTAADLAMRAPATGPCAWLGGKILDRLVDGDPVDATMLTSMALVDAYSYVSSDPARIDILIDLLPHVQRYAGRRQAELAEFTTARFPGYAEPFLDAAHGERMNEADRAEYFRLTGLDSMPLPGDPHPDDMSEADQRAKMARWIIAPVAERHRDRFLEQLLLASPLLSRVRALPRLDEVLPTEFRANVLAASVRELVHHAPGLGPEHLAVLVRIAEDLPSGDRSLFVDLAASLRGFDEPGDIEKAAFNVLYQDWSRMLRPHPKYEPLGPSVAAKIIGREVQDHEFRESYGFETLRVRYLAELAPHLEQDQISRAVALLRDFPEPERASALAALLPSANRDNARLIVAEIHALHSRFARLWALFRGQESLRENRAEFTTTAEGIVRAFDTAASMGAAALMLLGYLGVDRTMEILVDQARNASDDDTILKLLSLAVRTGKDAEHHERLCALLVRLSSPDTRYQALLMFARAGVRLGEHLGDGTSELLLTVHLRLSELSSLPRAEFLRELAGNVALVNAFVDDDDRVAIARGVREVCEQWRWP
ncbi:hypothetical protein [Phytohabitans aurantiacus]|uniref:Uncharacterized protein n=1 Tax=Phytohabitans aurantiacus TaxID=3016789 RepID=A0ABQ5R429_9ACTN|nr:hypothetical protein [Phytohabitans aurantiacus]GLI00642.1 hypothetical protein Pa4123_59180 [Phytohabitans aurantiacus]